MELDENNNPKQVCETQTTNCPSGTAFDGICLRLHEVEIGGSVVLEGVNFSSIDTKVQLTDMNGNVRQLDTYVCGDEDTPLTEIVNGKEVPIIDSRVHDRLSFGVPEDMAPGQYYLQVIVPNPNHVGGWVVDQLFSESITIELDVPSITVQISSETLHCIDETGVDWLGSDEVGIKIAALTDFAGDVQEPNNGDPIEFGDVDSGDDYTMDYLLFSNQQQIGGVAIMIRGWEIDGTDEYLHAVADYESAIKSFVKRTIIYYNEEETQCNAGVNEDDPDHHFYLEWKGNADSFGAFGVAFWGFVILGIIRLIIALIDGIEKTPIEKSNNLYREKRVSVMMKVVNMRSCCGTTGWYERQI
jgi:hypothetical protein